MAKQGITRRWIFNGLGVIVALLVVLEVAFAVVIRSYFYQRVETSLYTRAKSLSDMLSSYAEEPGFDFENSAREYVERFPDKEKMELQILSAAGAVLVSSTGFLPAEDKMPDFHMAIRSSNPHLEAGEGIWRGKNAAGETVTAMTIVIRDGSDIAVGAIRYLVSMEKINSQILLLITIMLLFGIAVIFFVMLSSSYFVSSIVNPIRDIGQAAGRLPWGITIPALKNGTTTRSGSCATPSIIWPGRFPRRRKPKTTSSVRFPMSCAPL